MGGRSDRLTSKIFSDGTAPHSYVYDENGDVGFLTSAAHGGHTFSWNYDLAGQLRSEVSSSASGPTSTVAYTYDLAGNRGSVSLDGAAWLTYDYDDASRLDKIIRGVEVFDFGYDDAHRRTSLDYTNLVHTAYGYDTLSRLLSVATTRNQTAISSSAYTYDDTGNRLTKTHPGLYAETYLYDPLDRVRQVTRDSTVSEQYTYDKVGNRNRPPWTYSDRNELLSNSSNTFEYDLRGNRTTKVDAADTWTYEWTAEDLLKRVLKNGLEVARYSYDPLGRRVERTVGQVAYQYVYDEEDVLREDFTSAIMEEGMIDPPPHLYVHGPGIDEPLAVKHGNDAKWHYYSDGLGSVLGATDATGAVSHTRKYDAFGNLQDGDDEQGYAFTGREWDPETGLYYYRARYYDPKIGRFISEDPIGFGGGINFYAYVGNNPVRFTDPYGLEAWTCRVPLGPMGNAGITTTKIPFVYHEYICVLRNGKMTCGSTTPKGPVPGPGMPTNEPYEEERCSPIKSGSCFEECLERKINEPDRPFFGIGPSGTDCQEWTGNTIRDCFNECLGKATGRQ